MGRTMQPHCELANGHFAVFFQATFATAIEDLAAVAPGRPAPQASGCSLAHDSGSGPRACRRMMPLSMENPS